MNSDSPKTPREEMEAWLTALLLGELSEGEAAAVRALMQHDAELAKLHARLQQAILLLREAEPKSAVPPEQTEPLRLSAERRRKLLTAFKIPPLKPADRKPKPTLRLRWVELVAGLVIVGVLLALLFPAFTQPSFRKRLAALTPLPTAKPDASAAGDAGVRQHVLESPLSQPSSGGVAGQPVNPANVVGYYSVVLPEEPPAQLADSLGTAPRLEGTPETVTVGGEVRRKISAPGSPIPPPAVTTPAPTPVPLASLPPPAPVALLAKEAAATVSAPAVAALSAPAIPVAPAEKDTPPRIAALADTSGREPARALAETAGKDVTDVKLTERYGRARSEGRKGVSVTEPRGRPKEPAVDVWYDYDSADAPANRLGLQPGGAPLAAGDSFGWGLGVSTNHLAFGNFGGGGGGGGSGTPAAASAGFKLLGPQDKAEEGRLALAPTSGVTVARLIEPATGLPRARADELSLDRSGVEGEVNGIYLGKQFSTSATPALQAGAFEIARVPLYAESSVGQTVAPPGNVDWSSRWHNKQGSVLFADKVTGLQRELRVGSVTNSPSPGVPVLGDTPIAGRPLKGESKPAVPTAIANADEAAAALHEAFERRYGVRREAGLSDYATKQRELEQLRGFARILDQKLASEHVDVKLQQQGASKVVIADRASKAAAKTGFWRSLGIQAGGDYASAARIKVAPDATDIEGMAGSRSISGYDPYFLQNEFEIIESDLTLGRVVDLLGLDAKWARQRGVPGKLPAKEAASLLRSKLDLKPVKDSSQIEIRVRSDDADEASQLANAVAEVYRDYRMQERLSRTTGGITSLEERYQEQQEKIKKAQEELEGLRAQLGISDLDTGGTVPLPPSKIESDIPAPRKPSTNAPIPQPEIQTSENSFSTFSLNVSDVSFKLAAASLEKGQMPDPASVRSEEFINTFDYRDPEAPPGTPIAFAWERARWPFVHNRDLLRFSLKTAAVGRQAGRPLNIVLLLDNSGSMERADRVRIIREALRVLAGQLQPQDKLSVVTFARTPRLVADGISGDKAGEVTEAVSGLTPQGGTNLEEAMNLAYQTALRHYLAGGINRVVLLTDGAANLGDVEPESLKQKVEAHRKQGVALDAFGIGWEGYNDDLLEVLSRNGDGRYGFINSPEEAATEFAGQLAGALKVAASDVKVQVEFNPRRVTSYRQIGYAKHQLTKEQFRDNTVDAAEIAAQEAGNALYTVEVNPAGDGPLCTVRCRFKIPGTTDYREQAWDVPYTGNAPSLEQSSPAMRLAASAAAFSEWLVISPFAGEVTPDRVLGCLSGVPEIYGADARPKKLEWMIRQAKSISGK